MAFWNQLYLLLWKNCMLKIRHKVRLMIELLWPTVLFLILMGVKTRQDLQEHLPECHFDGKALPSAGPLPFLQTFMCTLNNTCHERMTADEQPGIVDTYNQSLLSRVYNDLEILLSNETTRNNLYLLMEDYDNINKLADMIRDGQAKGQLKFGSLLMDPNELSMQIKNQSINISQQTLNELLNATLNVNELMSSASDSSWLTSLLESMLTGTDTSESIAAVRVKLCDQGMLTRLFNFSSPQAAADVQGQLCNLTTEEFTEFYQDIRADIEWPKMYKQLQDYITGNTGQGLNTSPEFVSRVTEFSRQLQALESLQQLQVDVQKMLADVQNISQAGNNSALIQSDLSRMFCGRAGSFMEINAQGTDWLAALDPATSDEVFVEKEGQEEIDAKLDESIFNETGSSAAEKCRGYISQFIGNTQYSKIIWHQMKPFIMGKIVYTPNTPAVQRLIVKASSFLNNIKELLNTTGEIMENIPQFTTALNQGQGGDNLQLIQSFLLSDNCKLYEKYLRNITGNMDVCSFLKNYGDPQSSNYNYMESLNQSRAMGKTFKDYVKCFQVEFKGYPNEAALINDSLLYIENNTFWAAVVFDTQGLNDVVPSHMQYSIRMGANTVDNTKYIMDRFYTPGPRRSPAVDMKYITYGFAYIQDMIDHAIIQEHTGNQSADTGIFLQQFPYPCYIYDSFIMVVGASLPLFMVLSWIFSVAMIIKGIVYEKETRLKEAMRIMGLGNAVHWLAWFITSLSVIFISIILLVLILKVGNVLEHTDASVILVFLLSFALSTISLCFLISVFFSRANLAAVCGGFIFLSTYLPFAFVEEWEDIMTSNVKMALSLISTTGFGMGCSYIARFEEQGVGAQWYNIAESPMPDDGFSLMSSIGIMLIDAIIYALFTWYLEAVLPGQYGIPRKWYFPIQKSYWCGYQYGDSSAAREYDCELNSNDNIEEEPSSLKLGVAVRNLRKVYSNGKKVALDGLSMNFYEGQITSFLGHNGAGKTTTMSILTGLFPPTAGTAYIYGKDICTSIDEIRKDMGMCPQYNVLFDSLSVEEHLWFYARLKGKADSVVKEEIEQMITDIGLQKKRRELTQHLSGGMKRKLSVAIAFMGGSRTVILDEPTAGVDPYARRAIWDLLIKFRKNRTIILSTHHMDEADILGDRIAIISQGKLCCCGSSLYLKGRYGSGYYLTLVRAEDADLVKSDDSDLEASGDSQPREPSVNSFKDVKIVIEDKDEGYAESERSSQRSDSDPPSMASTPPLSRRAMISGFSEDRLTAFIQKFIPNAKLAENIGSELCYSLPEEGAHKGLFERLFVELERCHADLGISSYGISDTTLEEVFLNVADETGVDEEPEEAKVGNTGEGGRFPRPVTRNSFRNKSLAALMNKMKSVQQSTSPRGSFTQLLDADTDVEDKESCTSVPVAATGPLLTGYRLKLNQFYALLVKRFHHVRRSKKGFVSEIILPAAFVLLAMIVTQITPPFSEDPPLILHPWLYTPKRGSPHLNTFYSNEAPGSEQGALLQQTLLTKPGIGNRCMNRSIYSISGYPCEGDLNGKWTAAPILTSNSSNDFPQCDCSSGIQVCPAGAGGPTPPHMMTPTSDNLYNLTGRNISDWLVKTTDENIFKRYGGISFGDTNPMVRMNNSEITEVVDRLAAAAGNVTGQIFGGQSFWKDIEDVLKIVATKDLAKVWYNNKGWASSVIHTNVMNNLLLRSRLSPDQNPIDFGITTINHPMNLTKGQLDTKLIYSSSSDLLVAICVLFAMSFIPASFILFLIGERVSNAKHLQFVSSVSPAIYWCSTFLWDMINYIIPSILCIFIFLAFQQKAYVSAMNAPCLVALLFLYGWAVIPMMYPFARIFNTPSYAFVLLACLNIFLGTISTLSTFILEALQDKDLQAISVILKQVFLLLPHYCLGRGLIDMSMNQKFADAFSMFGEQTYIDPFRWNQVGRNLLSMFCMGVFCFTLNMLIEYRFFVKFKPLQPSTASLGDEDIDVAKERERVTSGQTQNDVLVVKNLTKVYKTRGSKKRLVAADRICIGIPKGQCFGLLGVNGAGKTTTFKMLTGKTSVTKGDATLEGHSILTDLAAVRQNIGYCPQFDALYPLLTGREHLEFYARLRGIPQADVKRVADVCIRKLGLIQYADKITEAYSGGNRRKLSTAIALIGDPPVIFLDEPTTGMDPKARRFLWKCIQNIIKDGRSVILTSHSMEECEALCNRLAIMVNGRFHCLGSIQHLKSRFGDGYTVILRVGGSSPDLSPVIHFMSSKFPRAILKEQHHNMVQYELGSENMKLSKVFGELEVARARLNIEDYSVCQTTLDQVFINFAKLQTDVVDEDMEPPPELVGAVARYDIPLEAPAPSLGVPRNTFDEESVCDSTAGLVPADSSLAVTGRHNDQTIVV